MSTFENLQSELPTIFVNAVHSRQILEREFKDLDVHWYSPFILWTADEIDSYQPSYDDSIADYLAIGGNGGLETYLMHRTECSIWSIDLIAGPSSLVKVADSFGELLTLLECADD